MIRWSEDGPAAAIHILDRAMTTIGSDDPLDVAAYVDKRLNKMLHEWATTGRRAGELEAMFIAWTMMRFHVIAAGARREIPDDDVDRREQVELAIHRIREGGRKHQDWGLAAQQLAVELASIIDNR